MRKGLVLLAATVVLASCGREQAAQQSAAKLQKVTVQAADYKFSAPGALTSGAVEITLTNAGTEPHQGQLLRLKDGVTAGQLVEAGKKPNAEELLAGMATFDGGPNGIDPGKTQVATVGLPAGHYAFVCLIPDAKGRLHLGLGMVSELNVTQADEEIDVPGADYSSSAKEFSFVLPDQWQGTVAFENKGEQPHELQVIGIAPGKTADDVKKSFEAPPGSGPAGPPPWTAEAGGAVVAPGGTETFEVDLKPGKYFAMCFVTDPKRKAPHFALGMMQPFEVK
jgi:uncharacterized cupredoxin-like copper-binding protein